MSFRPKAIYMFQQEISQLNLQQLKAGEKRWVGHLQGSSAALLFKEIASQSQQLFIVVARNNQHLGQLESELEFYGIKPIIFPDWEILPYDRLSPHQDIVSERLSILSNMPKHGVLLLSASTLVQRVAPTSWVLGEHFDIQVGQKFQLEQQKADNAQAELDKQVEMRDELQAKYEEAAQLAKISYYKNTYGPVANQYKDLLGKLDSSIKENQKIIDNFEKLSAARDAYAQ